MKLSFDRCSLQQLSEQVYRVRLHFTGSQSLPFAAGQYLMLELGEAEIPLSIASAPYQQEWIELHLRVIPGHELAETMLNHFKSGEKVHISAPYGRCVLRDGTRPVLMIAGGTGLSPAHSMILQALHMKDPRPIRLYFGAQRRADLYIDDELNALQSAHGQFSYHPVLETAETDWQGLTGFPHQRAIEGWSEKLADFDIYVSGSPQMVSQVYQDLLSAGADKSHIYSDILDIRRDNGEAI